MAIRDIEEGEVLISLPYDVALTEGAALRHPILGALLNRSEFCSEQVMCMYILYEAHARESPLRLYMRLLPTEFSTPDYWPPEALPLLANPLRTGKVERRKQKIQKFYDGVQSLIESHPSLFPAEDYTLAAFTWAYNVLDSRAFSIPSPEPKRHKHDHQNESEEGDKEEEDEEEGEEEEGVEEEEAAAATGTVNEEDDWALFPLADMMNHSLDGETEFGFDIETNRFTVTSSRTYAKGEQIFLKYNSMGNWHLLKHYGFILPNNPHDSYPVTLPPPTTTSFLNDSVFQIAKWRLFEEHDLLSNLEITRTGESDTLLSSLRIRFMSEPEFPSFTTALRGAPISQVNDCNVYQCLMRYCKQQLAGLPDIPESDFPVGSSHWAAAQIASLDREILRAALHRTEKRYRELCQLLYYERPTALLPQMQNLSLRFSNLSDPQKPVAHFTRINRLVNEFILKNDWQP
eukprot:NODE_1360_length_1538_cov_6.440113_g1287_i0.p1 GENE.NODE_1360_length_1538_cov_6.440113_g1287_i0~~NODE_1360_length_1538_cov_6.440113_g1287_i0.p1  ORF type:complete len:492 (+),score=124.62 NODE_1360_length_1538_cov_6.440113_g1287_i0:99-1478(+)